MPIDAGDSTTRSINLTNAAGAPVAADSTPIYAITLPNLTVGTPPTVLTGATGEYYVVYPNTTSGLHREVWTAIVAGVTIVIRRSFVVEDPAKVAFIDTDEALAHLRSAGIIVSPGDLEQLRWLCMVASSAVEDDLGRVIAARSVTETRDGGPCALPLRTSPVISITSVTESGTLLTTDGYVIDVSNAILYRGGTLTPRSFTWGRQNIVIVYVVGYPNPPRIARKVALNGVERMWQSSQQTAHPLLDDVSATEAIFAAAGTLTPLELNAYNSLRLLGVA